MFKIVAAWSLKYVNFYSKIFKILHTAGENATTIFALLNTSVSLVVAFPAAVCKILKIFE